MGSRDEGGAEREAGWVVGWGWGRGLGGIGGGEGGLGIGDWGLRIADCWTRDRWRSVRVRWERWFQTWTLAPASMAGVTRSV